MQRLIAIAALGFGLVLSASAFGQAPFLFDELGNGQFGPGNPMPDPGPGGRPNALTYPLPFAGTPGDLFMTEPPTNSLNSDLIRWNGNGTLIFYSDIPDAEPPQLADIGLPNAFHGNQQVLPQSGVEGGIQDLFYTPAPGMPGYDPSAPGATYHFISDLPEPGCVSVLGATACLLGLRRRARAAA